MSNNNEDISALISASKVVMRSIETEMETCYGDYALSVIASRALPDARDGLKPVHRRILFSMHELGLTPDKGHRKCARIVGDVLGKYHPHGDTAVYDALVRMAQDFSLRAPLVDGHGNFGSVDGDSAAAMRYTEARLCKLALEMTRDIDKNTVEFMANFDGEEQEPVVLPSRFPNLLVNGSSGIAVGMATHMPPHNLNEIVEAICKVIDNKVIDGRATDVEELIAIVKGPDFPTSGLILGTSGFKEAYRTGRGKVVMRGKAEIETDAKGRSSIIITEIPYQVNKAKLVESIADLVKDKKIEGISDLRDESDRDGLRVVVDIKRDVNASVILNQLYKHTKLQDTFGVNNLALVNSEPKVLNLLDLITIYLDHQKDVVTRRTIFELDKAEKRAHIVEGLFIALDHIDEVISVIRASSDTKDARTNLMARFGLSDVQASAIVEMRLRGLTGLERDKLQKEYDELVATITYLNSILGDEHILYGVLRTELVDIGKNFGDVRRTQVTMNIDDLVEADLIADEPCVITMTSVGYIKRLPATTYKNQKRGGKGVLGMQTRESDVVRDLLVCKTHDTVLFFTNKGKVHSKKVYELPECGRNAKGTAIVNLLNLGADEQVKAIIPIRDLSDVNKASFVMITKRGTIKKTYVNEFTNIRQQGLKAINIVDGDELVQVEIVTDEDTLFVATNKGLGCRFASTTVRNMGRTATGVRAIKTSELNYVIGFVVCKDSDRIVFVSDKGFGKATNACEFTVKNRGIKGVLAYNVVEKTGQLSSILTCDEEDELMLVNTAGVVIRIKASVVPLLSRHTLGAKLISLDAGDHITSISKVVREPDVVELAEVEPDVTQLTLEEY